MEAEQVSEIFTEWSQAHLTPILTRLDVLETLMKSGADSVSSSDSPKADESALQGLHKAGLCEDPDCSPCMAQRTLLAQDIGRGTRHHIFELVNQAFLELGQEHENPEAWRTIADLTATKFLEIEQRAPVSVDGVLVR